MPPPQAGWQRSRVIALFADEAAGAPRRPTLLLAQDWADGVQVRALAPVPDAGLGAPDAVAVRAGRDHARASGSCRPGTSRRPRRAQVIRLDPGLAFGTGTHPTTRMCLRWIARARAAGWPRVLDYGCGSGILAIGAALFGAAADRRGRHRPGRGRGDARQRAGQRRRAERRPARRGAAARYALVLANILATPLKLLAPLLCGARRAGRRSWCWPASSSARPTS